MDDDRIDLLTPHLPFNRDSLRGRFVPGKRTPPPADRSGYWFLVQKEALLLPDGDGPLALPSGRLPQALEGSAQAVIYLGTYEGQACWAAAVAADAPLPAGFHKESIVPRDTRLTDDLLSLSGIALQALHWQRMSRHCPCCGKASVAIEGEWGRRCPECHAEHYPSLHPAVIVLVRDGERVVLTRKSFWPKNRYGLVAGFVDAGESLEEAVRREVLEEVGFQVTEIRYVASQYWPFPSQLMIGFTARYAGGELRVDREELEDARWFSVHALPDLPPKLSIARYILDRFAVPR